MIYSRPIPIFALKRTPIGRLGGTLSHLNSVDLGVAAARSVLDTFPKEHIELVVAGQVLQAGCGMNPARQVLLGSGIGENHPAETINMVCGSGLRAVASIADSIALGQIQSGLALGMESMSQAPHFLRGLRRGVRLGNSEMVDSILAEGLCDPTVHLSMGETAELLADCYGISREEQDEYATLSQHRHAANKSFWAEEIIPLYAPKTKAAITEDEHPRPDTTLAALAKLKPAFRPDGTVTAGNSSGVNDGAAAVVLAAEAFGNDKPSARILGWSAAGCDPKLMGLGPAFAIRNLTRELGSNLQDFEAIEINEAFAAQILACLRELNLSSEKVNPVGGAIAMGHPIGCSGARVLVTLVHHLQRRGGGRGIASLCIGGGMGIALAVAVD
jgi:acetyl-CoA C-acetyltransferase